MVSWLNASRGVGFVQAVEKSPDFVARRNTFVNECGLRCDQLKHTLTAVSPEANRPAVLSVNVQHVF
jgi:hypothetical protein